MRCLWLAVSMLVLSMLTGCQESSAPAEPSPMVSTNARSGPAEISLTLNRESMRTVDRLTIEIESYGWDGAAIDPPSFDPTTAGWTVISRVDTPLLFSDGGPKRQVTVVLEPFLAGTYEIPAVSVDWTLPTGERGIVATEPLRIDVASVLDDNDVGDIAGPTNIVLPHAPQTGGETRLAFVVGGAIVVTLGVVLAVAMCLRRAPTKDTTPLERLRALQSSDCADTIAAAIADALHRSSERSDSTSGILSEVEHARYGRKPMTHDRALQLLRQTIALLAPGPGGAA